MALTQEQITDEEQLPVFYTELKVNGSFRGEIHLPVSDYEVNQFLYRCKCDVPDAEYTLELEPYHHMDIHDNIDLTGAKLQELNYLARKIANFDEYQKECFDAFVKTQETNPVTKLINAAHSINDIILHPASNDKELGEFVLGGEMLEEYNSLPDEIYQALDKEKAGAKYRKMMNGKFVNGGYLDVYQIEEVYDGITLPDSKPLSPFRICLCNDDENNSTWLDLPAGHNDFAPIADKYDVHALEDLYMLDFNSAIPYIKTNCEVNIDCFDELNELARTVKNMDQAQIRKFKAVLEVEQPFFIKDALELSNNLNKYDLYSHLTNPNDYGKMMVCQKLGLEYDDAIVQFIDNTEFGAELMKRNGIVPTQYGGLIVPPTVEETQTADIDAGQDAAEEDSEDQGFHGMAME